LPDWITLSKTLPEIVYPLNLALLLLTLALVLVLFGKRAKGVILMIVSLTIVITSASPLASALYRKHEQIHSPVAVANSPSAGAIVVLAGDVGIPNPPRVTSELRGNRLLHALRIYKAGKAPVIMVTGGNVFMQAGLNAEAAYSKSILQDMGVPSEAILIEVESRNTRQSAVNSRRILGGLGVDQILLVTSGIHMPRAAEAFGAVGFDVLASPSGFAAVDAEGPTILAWMPSLAILSRSHELTREYIGLFVYQLRGWLR